jgi:tRNA G10  N-methylase Trm11
MQHFAVFGTHPRLSLAEFRAVLPPKTPSPTLIGQTAIVEDSTWDGPALMQRLGGTVKLGDILEEYALSELTAERVVDLLEQTPRDERVVFGLTIYGGTPAAKRGLQKLPLEVKRELKNRGKSARWVTSENDEPLTPAAVAKLKLTTEGYDVVILIDSDRASIGLTTHVQDADAWSLRDFGRPVRDDENGMLPPKLARIMVNLARVPARGTLLDPFCGSGTVLMEAALATQADHLIGSDIESKQIADAKQNQDWLITQHILGSEDAERFSLFTRDVRTIQHDIHAPVDAVVTEGYLGPPLRGSESAAMLARNADEITDLWRDALKALAPTLAPSARLVCIWPAMKTSHGTARVDLTEDLTRLGYTLENPLDGWDETNGPLLYSRPNQRIMRRIVVLTPNAHI